MPALFPSSSQSASITIIILEDLYSVIGRRVMGGLHLQGGRGERLKHLLRRLEVSAQQTGPHRCCFPCSGPAPAPPAAANRWAVSGWQWGCPSSHGVSENGSWVWSALEWVWNMHSHLTARRQWLCRHTSPAQCQLGAGDVCSPVLALPNPWILTSGNVSFFPIWFWSLLLCFYSFVIYIPILLFSPLGNSHKLICNRVEVLVQATSEL